MPYSYTPLNSRNTSSQNPLPQKPTPGMGVPSGCVWFLTAVVAFFIAGIQPVNNVINEIELYFAPAQDPRPREIIQTETISYCKLDLQLSLRQGPNSGQLAILGQVAMTNMQSSAYQGTLHGTSGILKDMPIQLAYQESQVSFILTTDLGKMYGSGMMEAPLSECRGDGGGLLSGPALGDLGDWRASWTFSQETVSNKVTLPPEVQREPNLLVILLNLGMMGLYAVAVFVIIRALITGVYSFMRGNRPVNNESDSLRRAESGKPTVNAQGERLPIVEYQTVYTTLDRLFDLSFDVERAGQYMGECGIQVSRLPDSTETRTFAFECWLFDATNLRTQGENTTKVLMSRETYTDPALRAAYEPKGQIHVVQPGNIFVVETTALVARFKVMDVQYEADGQDRFFKKVIFKIGVWEKTNQPGAQNLEH